MFSSNAPPSKRFKEANGDNGAPAYPTERINTEPSIVVHVRQLSPKATEADLLEALASFGHISYVTIFRSKSMGLVEFETLQGAQKCVQYAQNNAIFVCGQPALFNFSTSKQIQRLGFECEKPNRVLVMHVYNAIYPINVETIHTISKQHGDVQRIAIMRRNTISALVEFASIEQALTAKRALNGADIYSGCCTLKVEYAKSEFVRVDRNDQDQWDFVSPPPESSPARPEPRKSLLGGPPDQMAPMNNQMGGMGGGNMGMGQGQQGMMQQQQGYNNNPNGGFGGGGMGGMQQQQQPFGGGPQGGFQQGGMGGGMQGGGGGGGPPGGYNNQYNNQGGPRGAGGMMQQGGPGMGTGGPRGGGNMMMQGGAVAMVYGIDHDNWNCDKIFNLLCLYGNIVRIKLMRTKTDTAMVEFGSPDQMHCACKNLQNIDIFQGSFVLRPSKQTTVEGRGPFPLPDGTDSFKDYTNSRNNRYMSEEAARKNRIVPPGKTLHWYNAPTNLDEEKIKEIFGEHDAPVPVNVTVFATKSARSSTGTLEFESVRDATEALIKIQHTEIPSPTGKVPYILKLAFASERRGRFGGD